MSARTIRRGVTLIELLVVLAIIAVLMALLLSGVQQVRASALRLQCLSNLRQIGLALHGYHDTNYAFPPGYAGDPYPNMTWETHLLPFIEQSALWDQAVEAYALDSKFWDLPPHPFSHRVTLFTCPADARALRVGNYFGLQVAFTSYVGVEGVAQFRQNGILYADSRVRFTDITDGTSNTLMVGERPVPVETLPFGWWYAGGGQGGTGSAGAVLAARERNIAISWCPPGPYAYGAGRANNPCDAFHFWSLHAGGGNFLFADGSVRFLPYAVAPLMPALASRNGGEAISLPDGSTSPSVRREPALLPKRRKGYTLPTFTTARRSIVVPGKEPDGLHRYVPTLRLAPRTPSSAAAAPADPRRAAPVGGGGQLSPVARHGESDAAIARHPRPPARRRRSRDC